MAVQLNIPYETLVELIEQLPPDQQQELAARLLEKTETLALTIAERKARYRAAIMSVPLNKAPSIRREDWYGDDGR